MNKSRINALSDVERALRFQPQDLVNVLLEIRNIVMSMNPSATERINSRGLTFFDAEKGGTIKGGICFVDIQGDHVRLRFGLGSFLDDPKSLLSGDQLHMRYLDISSYDDAPWADIEALIQASANLDGSVLNS
ncbi:MAG: DUF1801 domain-containing protein [Anaerolineaceae bacterium]|nr:DUF1801 domain-containing protein [Anaerolineaceae bacterium]